MMMPNSSRYLPCRQAGKFVLTILLAFFISYSIPSFAGEAPLEKDVPVGVAVDTSSLDVREASNEDIPVGEKYVFDNMEEYFAHAYRPRKKFPWEWVFASIALIGMTVVLFFMIRKRKKENYG